jgi:hypothetical protein
MVTGPIVGPSVADLAQQMLDELTALRRQKAVDDALMPIVRDLLMAMIEALRNLKVAAHQVIVAWRLSPLELDQPGLRAAIEELVRASGWVPDAEGNVAAPELNPHRVSYSDPPRGRNL